MCVCTHIYARVWQHLSPAHGQQYSTSASTPQSTTPAVLAAMLPLLHVPALFVAQLQLERQVRPQPRLLAVAPVAVHAVVAVSVRQASYHRPLLELAGPRVLDAPRARLEVLDDLQHTLDEAVRFLHLQLAFDSLQPAVLHAAVVAAVWRGPDQVEGVAGTLEIFWFI